MAVPGACPFPLLPVLAHRIFPLPQTSRAPSSCRPTAPSPTMRRDRPRRWRWPRATWWTSWRRTKVVSVSPYQCPAALLPTLAGLRLWGSPYLGCGSHWLPSSLVHTVGMGKRGWGAAPRLAPLLREHSRLLHRGVQKLTCEAESSRAGRRESLGAGGGVSSVSSLVEMPLLKLSVCRVTQCLHPPIPRAGGEEAAKPCP